MKKTVKADEYEGAVYWPDRSGDYGEGYFSDVEEVRDYCEREGVSLPGADDPAYGCTSHHIVLSADDVIDRELESGEYYDGAEENVSKEARDALALLLGMWSEKYGKEVVTYQQDPDLVLDFGP